MPVHGARKASASKKTAPSANASAKARTNTTAYLGRRGYTLRKAELSEEERHEVRSSLTVKPVVPKMVQAPNPFPVYLESVQKMYVPLYWGIERFGPPAALSIPRGDDVALKFHGSMRDYQEAIVAKYMRRIEENEAAGRSFGGGLFDVMTGSGKTVMALNVVSRMRKKALIVVHKSFLMNQWLERIGQFLPDARVGRIQGEVVDVEGKDIVIGMLQSLSMKEYHEDTFASFGLLVCDEVHHLSAEVFVRALQRIVVPYTLGLSATMQRKDGLSKVFKMFMGEVLHKDKRTNEHAVTVRACRYKSDDAAFNEVRYDWRGNPMYSVMISKLCAFAPRSEYIVELILREFSLGEAQEGAHPIQMMVIAHNKSLLVYLYKALTERHGLSSVGYYVGGMKERDLKSSEERKIILATYAMASEGLDIKTLTTLLMATPKTDVTQSVGRILRIKGHRPVVIDVVDEHDLFQGQWRRRAAYYRKAKYAVEEQDSRSRRVRPSDQGGEFTLCEASAGHDDDQKDEDEKDEKDEDEKDEESDDKRDEDEDASPMGTCHLLFRKR